MPSNINPAVPPLGNATTSGVRANFAAAKAEIELLQTARAIRVQHVSEALDVFQRINANNTQQVIAFNEVLFNNGGVFNWDAPNNELEFLEAGYYAAVINFQVVRKITGAAADFNIHAELKPPAGAFTDFPGSSRYITLDGAQANHKDWRAYTVVTRIPLAGYKLRMLQVTTDASKDIGIVTYASQAPSIPGAAGIVMSLFKLGEEL